MEISAMHQDAVSGRAPAVLATPLRHWQRLAALAERWIEAPALLAVRLYMAQVFFSAGLARVNNWDSQALLFTDIHPVPFLPGSLAAPLTTLGELTLPVLLALGLIGRVAGIGLFAMTAVIQLIVAQTPQGIENGIGHGVHYLWMAALAVIVARGPGALSLDALLWRRFGLAGRP